MSPSHTYHRQSAQQRGFLLPAALFILVVLGVLAAAMTRFVSQSGSGAVLDAVTTQAFYAAESGAQLGMHRLFYQANLTRQQADGQCASLNQTLALTAPGLTGCRVVIQCQCRFQNNTPCDSATAANYDGSNAITHSLYTVQSRAQCGAGSLSAERVIEVGAAL